MRRAFTFLFITLASSAAAAQGVSILTVPVVQHADQRSGSFQMAAKVGAVGANLGWRYVSATRARERLLVEQSRDPAEVSEDFGRRFLREGESAMEALRTGRDAASIVHLEKAQELLGGAIEVLARREPGRVFQLCVLDVRQSLLSGEEDLALSKARACDAKFPSFAPEKAPPPDVQALFDRAAQLRREERLGALTVRATRPGCRVYVNGNDVGPTPFTQSHPPGGPRLVQVECGDASVPGSTYVPGRVHTIEARSEPTELLIDVEFEGAVRTKAVDRIYLQYNGNLREQVDNYRHDALRLATLVGASEALVVLPLAGGRFSLQRVAAQWARSVEVSGVEVPETELRAALEVLFEGEAPSSMRPRTAAEPGSGPSGEPPSRTVRLAVGSSALAASAALYAAAWVTYGKRVDKGRTFRATLPSQSGYIERGNDWADSRPVPYWLAAAALPLGSFGLDFMLDPYLVDHGLYISSAAGAAGLGLVVWGAVEVARGGPCAQSTAPDRRACVLAQEQTDRGGLLLLSAAPLLQLPAYHLGRWLASGRDLRASLSPSRTGLAIAVSGAF